MVSCQYPLLSIFVLVYVVEMWFSVTSLVYRTDMVCGKDSVKVINRQAGRIY